MTTSALLLKIHSQCVTISPQKNFCWSCCASSQSVCAGFFPLLFGARVWVHSVPSPLAGHQPAGTDWELNITSSRDVRLFHAGLKLQQRAHTHRTYSSPPPRLFLSPWFSTLTPPSPFPFLRIGTCLRYTRRGANTVQEFDQDKRKNSPNFDKASPGQEQQARTRCGLLDSDRGRLKCHRHCTGSAHGSCGGM